MRIAHCIPAYRSQVHIEVALGMARDAEFCWTNGGDAAHHYQHIHMPFFVDCSGIARARNLGVERAIAAGADLLLFQDTDVFMPVTKPNQVRSPACSALEALLGTLNNNLDAAAVGAACCIRNGNRMNCEPARPGEVYPGIVGTGLMLIDLRKIADIPRPWFRHYDTQDGLGVECGEDVYFCRLLQKHGHMVIVDYSIETGHAGGVVDLTRIS